MKVHAQLLFDHGQKIFRMNSQLHWTKFIFLQIIKFIFQHQHSCVVFIICTLIAIQPLAMQCDAQYFLCTKHCSCVLFSYACLFSVKLLNVFYIYIQWKLFASLICMFEMYALYVYKYANYVRFFLYQYRQLIYIEHWWSAWNILLWYSVLALHAIWRLRKLSEKKTEMHLHHEYKRWTNNASTMS